MKKSPIASAEARDDREGPRRTADRRFVLGHLGVGGDPERLDAHRQGLDERDDTTDDGHAVAAGGGGPRGRSAKVSTSISPCAPREGIDLPVVAAVGSTGLRTATAQ